MTLATRQPQLLYAFIGLSLLLHLLALWLLPRLQPQPVTSRQPIYVEMLPPAVATPQSAARPRELDLPPQAATPRTRPAQRLGPQDVQVEREQAPVGTAPEDRPARPAAPPASPSSGTAASEPGVPPTTTTGERALRPAPSREQLLASAASAAQGVAGREVEEWRSKLREEVARGEAVWLDTEKDLLVSFFKRFRDGIYLVWNYPERAIAQNQQGVCLLRITINRAGLVEDVSVVKSSGYPLLDQAAVDAVHKASSFYGYLPESYPKPTLTIFAFFHYTLGGRFLYGSE